MPCVICNPLPARLTGMACSEGVGKHSPKTLVLPRMGRYKAQSLASCPPAVTQSVTVTATQLRRVPSFPPGRGTTHTNRFPPVTADRGDKSP
jgi:hypothetical protein